MKTTKADITNWKLVEVLDEIEIVDTDPKRYIRELLKRHSLPHPGKWSMTKDDTHIDWELMPTHHRFYYDSIGEEDLIKEKLRFSALSKTDSLIIEYFHSDLVVKVPTKLFIEDWEGFFRSVLWEAIIHNEDAGLIMESSRAYYLHSNFPIH